MGCIESEHTRIEAGNQKQKGLRAIAGPYAAPGDDSGSVRLPQDANSLRQNDAGALLDADNQDGVAHLDVLK